MSRQNTSIADSPADPFEFGLAFARIFAWAWAALLILGSIALVHHELTKASGAADDQPARPWRLEALAGQCKAEPLGEGNWYHSAYPYELGLRSGCYQVSISEIVGAWRGWNTGLRFGYVSLGEVTVDAIWWLRDQDLAGRPDGNSCTLGIDGNAKDCLGKGHLRQTAKGFALGGLMERDLAKYLRVGLEGGVFVYEGSFQTSLESYPEHIHYTGWTGSYNGLQLSPYLGTTVNVGYLMVSARVYTLIRAAEHGCAGCSGPTRGPVTQLAAGLSITF